MSDQNQAPVFLNWSSPQQIHSYSLYLSKQIRRMKAKLRNPVHSKTGAPLAASTLKSYETAIKAKNKEREQIKAALAELGRHGISHYDGTEYPGLQAIIRFGGPWLSAAT